MAVEYTDTYKILVIGDVNVGKTCLVHRFCDERYYDTYISTVGEFNSMLAGLIFRWHFALKTSTNTPQKCYINKSLYYAMFQSIIFCWYILTFWVSRKFKKINGAGVITGFPTWSWISNIRKKRTRRRVCFNCFLFFLLQFLFREKNKIVCSIIETISSRLAWIVMRIFFPKKR